MISKWDRPKAKRARTAAKPRAKVYWRELAANSCSARVRSMMACSSAKIAERERLPEGAVGINSGGKRTRTSKKSPAGRSGREKSTRSAELTMRPERGPWAKA